MEKQSHNNFKIKYILLSILFSILFIFTALNISTPLTAYAEETTTIGQIMNLDSYSANEDDESTNEQAGYLYWAASSRRCGVLFYVVDDFGKIQTQGLIMDNAGKEEFGNYVKYGYNKVPGIKGKNILEKRLNGVILEGGVPSGNNIPVYWRDGISPVAYSGGWQANGSSSMAYLMEQATYPSGAPIELEIKGQRTPCPNWAYFVNLSEKGRQALKQLADPDTKWNVIIEPVSVNYMYTNNTFTNDTVDATGMEWKAGSPMPEGATNEDGWMPVAYIATGYRLIDISTRVTGQTGGGTYTYKLYNKQLPFSLCLSEDIEVAHYIGGATGARDIYTGLTSSVYRIGKASDIGYEGIAMASIDITGFAIPPLHTYDGTNTPGNTEPPSPDNGTDGDCTIKKLYYTQKISSDGTILTEATDYHYYTQTSTTAYISIDTESDYEIEGWKTSTTNTTLNTKEQFNSITPTHTGTSSQEILLDKDAGEKYLYILYKKTEVNPNPPQPYDFQLQQSQITKRVSFMTPDANSTTQQLFTHNFTWTASAPTQTSCTANSNKGHLKCTTSEHTHSDGCYTEDADGNKSLTCTTSEHTHTDSCYEKCSSWKWTDNTTSLGITLDTTSTNKAVVSKNNSITYNQPAVNTITTSNKYYKNNTSTRSGTSQNTQSISNFNYITVLFRGQDHLTLADWKNGGAISYLTNLAYPAGFIFLHIFTNIKYINLKSIIQIEFI